ncbi:MAG TPA: hypothetical protein VE258_18100, partial [Ktedonobacterales bacterium]|nr:hypothetical protein [Ktedonobacterales bacterium]
PAPEPALDARWAQHHLDFNFFGHTGNQHIYYNCDAVEAKVERLLRLAGARKDMKVRAYCAVGPERVAALIRVALDFKSPTLAPQPVPVQAGDTPLPAAARWQPVSLRLGGTLGFDQGDCLLVDQFRMQVLKVFDLRNLTVDLPCSVRFGPPRGRQSLAFEALTATPTAEKESIQFEQQPKKHDDKLKSDRS